MAWKRRGILKHVLEAYDTSSHQQSRTSEIAYDVCITQADRATKAVCNSRKQELYHLNLPKDTHLLSYTGAGDKTIM